MKNIPYQQQQAHTKQDITSELIQLFQSEEEKHQHQTIHQQQQNHITNIQDLKQKIHKNQYYQQSNNNNQNNNINNLRSTSPYGKIENTPRQANPVLVHTLQKIPNPQHTLQQEINTINPQNSNSFIAQQQQQQQQQYIIRSRNNSSNHSKPLSNNQINNSDYLINESQDLVLNNLDNTHNSSNNNNQYSFLKNSQNQKNQNQSPYLQNKQKIFSSSSKSPQKKHQQNQNKIFTQQKQQNYSTLPSSSNKKYNIFSTPTKKDRQNYHHQIPYSSNLITNNSPQNNQQHQNKQRSPSPLQQTNSQHFLLYETQKNSPSQTIILEQQKLLHEQDYLEFQKFSEKNQRSLSKKNSSSYKITPYIIANTQQHQHQQSLIQKSNQNSPSSKPQNNTSTSQILKTSITLQNKEIEYWKEQYKTQLQQKESLLEELNSQKSQITILSQQQNQINQLQNTPFYNNLLEKEPSITTKDSSNPTKRSVVQQQQHQQQQYQNSPQSSSQKASSNSPPKHQNYHQQQYFHSSPQIEKLQKQFETLQAQYDQQKTLIKDLQSQLASKDFEITNLQNQLKHPQYYNQKPKQQQPLQQQFFQQIQQKFDPNEWKYRCQLASIYRLLYLYKYLDQNSSKNNISLKIYNNQQIQFLTSSFSLPYDRTTPYNLQKSDPQGNIDLYIEEEQEEENKPLSFQQKENLESLKSYILNSSFHLLHQKIYQHNKKQTNLNCLLFLQDPHSILLSQLKHGIKFYTQQSLQQFQNKISYFELQHPIHQKKQSQLLAQNLQENKQIVIVKNQGLLITSDTIQNLFIFTHSFMQYTKKYLKSFQQNKPDLTKKNPKTNIQDQKYDQKEQWQQFLQKLENHYGPNWLYEKGPLISLQQQDNNKQNSEQKIPSNSNLNNINQTQKTDSQFSQNSLTSIQQFSTEKIQQQLQYNNNSHRIKINLSDLEPQPSSSNSSYKITNNNNQDSPLKKNQQQNNKQDTNNNTYSKTKDIKNRIISLNHQQPDNNYDQINDINNVNYHTEQQNSFQTNNNTNDKSNHFYTNSNIQNSNHHTVENQFSQIQNHQQHQQIQHEQEEEEYEDEALNDDYLYAITEQPSQERTIS